MISSVAVDVVSRIVLQGRNVLQTKKKDAEKGQVDLSDNSVIDKCHRICKTAKGCLRCCSIPITSTPGCFTNDWLSVHLCAGECWRSTLWIHSPWLLSYQLLIHWLNNLLIYR